MAGAAALAGNKAGFGRLAADPLCGAVLQAGVLVGDYRPYGLATVGIPCGLALVATGRPLAGSLGRGLAMGRSYIRVFQIRMEKMKEVKRPPSSGIHTMDLYSETPPI
ncbi:hypothetical protein BHE74_00054373 [Ensete ventricosum]|nr:hypothetical protein GW17_00019126 [Ensete ventricosum]RWW40229.1 hypothetical protein BHE74_00054373 [Ensete ventricosum]RZS18769.1 hypothetical protein BHM03_00051090 [Ensete ventricosum]